MASGSDLRRAGGATTSRLELEAERAAAEHWRRVAEQRAAEYAELRRRPLVRASLAAERWTGRARAQTTTAARAVQSAAAAASLPRQCAWPIGCVDPTGSSCTLRHPLAPEATPAFARSVVLAVVGSRPSSLVDDGPTR